MGKLLKDGTEVYHQEWGFGVVKDQSTYPSLILIVFDNSKHNLHDGHLGEEYCCRCWFFNETTMHQLEVVIGVLLENE